MEYRHAVRGAPMRGLTIEVVLQDGFDRAIGPGADLQRAGRGGLQPLYAERLAEPDDAEAGAEALLGMWPVLQDQFAQQRRGRPDARGFPPDALDRPVRVPAMAGGHVLGDGGVLAVAAAPQMGGDPLALVEDFEGR